jgi:hypothetical protein
VAAHNLVTVEGARPLSEVAVSVPHLIERPGQVHRRGTRFDKERHGFLEIVPACSRECVTVCGRDSDCRRTAHRESTNGIGDLAGRPAFKLYFLLGQPPLIEEHDAVVLEAENLFGLEVSDRRRRRR